MLSKSTIYKQKKKFFALVSISLCLLLPTLIFYKITPKSQKCNSSCFNLKKQRGYIRLSMWFRRQKGKQRRKSRRKPKDRQLQKKRRRRRECWNISNDSKTRCQRKRPPYWRGLKDPRLQDSNTRRSLLEIRRGNSSLRRLKGGNKRNTIGAPQLR